MIPCFILLILLSSGVDSFKILVFYPTPSYSHQRAILALTERLVQDGHELFVVSTNAVPGLVNSNYTYVDLSFFYEHFSEEKREDTIVLQQHIPKWGIIDMMRAITLMVEKQLTSEPFLHFQKKVKTEKIKFDLVITESFFIPFTCGIARLIAKNAPIISMTTVSTDFVEDNLGSIHHPSFVPSVLGDYSDKMSLWQRMENWFSHHYLMFKVKNIVEDGAKNFFKKTYGNENLACGCWNNASLSLIASSHLYFYPRLLGPNVIELGAMHIKPPKKLPKNLQEWLDGAEKGVIYFCLGSNMKSKSLPIDVRSNFLKFFRELPPGYRVLWKWELDGKIPGQSDNILGQKWLPQESILAHPKVKVFITQGGLQSFHETVHYGVPTVGIPWFGDQECDVAKMVDAEIGVQLRPYELHSYEKIKAALEAVLNDERYDDFGEHHPIEAVLGDNVVNDKRYSRNMKRLSAISRDFTAQALDKAVFWVEHVAKHGGASHLRPLTADTTYFQFFCLDIISVILAFSCISAFIAIKFSRFLISTMFSPLNSKIKKS